MRIPHETLLEIQNRLDMAEVVGQYVVLQKRGGRYWGRCPFHEEKTPSFSVTPERGVFYCFGCHKGGDLFTFVMEVEKVSFVDAVELLARKAGVEIHVEGVEDGGAKRETFLELNKRLAASFHWLLMESPQAESARAYMQRRGMTRQTLELFQIGYAPADREWLRRFLVSKNYSEEFLAKTGLFSGSSGGKSALFANRIIFPIATLRGDILAFGGRALVDGVPKYLNSPETTVFRKGENLFAIDKALPQIKKSGDAIVVEGYMDVMAMHQAGMTGCVAPLGTALTEAQVRLLKRYANEVVLVFDSDEAGEKATLRALELLEKQDVPAKVVVLKGGKDPADIVTQEGPQAIERQMASPIACFPFLVDKAVRRFGTATPEAKQAVCGFLFPFAAAAASQVRSSDYVRIVAETVGVDEAAVRADFTRWSRAPVQAAQGRSAAPAAQATVAMTEDLFLMIAVSSHLDLFPAVRTAGIGIMDLDDSRARELFVALEEAYRAEERSLEAVVGRLADASLKDILLRRVASGEFDENADRMVSDGLRRIRLRTLKRRGEEVTAALNRRPERHLEQELLAEKQHIDQELEKLRGPRQARES